MRNETKRKETKRSETKRTKRNEKKRNEKRKTRVTMAEASEEAKGADESANQAGGAKQQRRRVSSLDLFRRGARRVNILSQLGIDLSKHTWIEEAMENQYSEAKRKSLVLPGIQQAMSTNNIGAESRRISLTSMLQKQKSKSAENEEVLSFEEILHKRAEDENVTYGFATRSMQHVDRHFLQIEGGKWADGNSGKKKFSRPVEVVSTASSSDGSRFFVAYKDGHIVAVDARESTFNAYLSITSGREMVLNTLACPKVHHEGGVKDILVAGGRFPSNFSPRVVRTVQKFYCIMIHEVIVGLELKSWEQMMEGRYYNSLDFQAREQMRMKAESIFDRCEGKPLEKGKALLQLLSSSKYSICDQFCDQELEADIEDALKTSNPHERSEALLRLCEERIWKLSPTLLHKHWKLPLMNLANVTRDDRAKSLLALEAASNMSRLSTAKKRFEAVIHHIREALLFLACGNLKMFVMYKDMKQPPAQFNIDNPNHHEVKCVSFDETGRWIITGTDTGFSMIFIKLEEKRDEATGKTFCDADFYRYDVAKTEKPVLACVLSKSRAPAKGSGSAKHQLVGIIAGLSNHLE